MDLIDSKTDEELLRSLLAEIAKSKNEIQCARRDIEKTQSRLEFSIVLVNKLINRQEIKR
jgi:hypothetical protein